MQASPPLVPLISVSPIPALQHLSPVLPEEFPVNEGRLIDIDEPASPESAPQSPVPSSLPGLTTPSEILASSTVESAATSIPRLGPVNNAEWRELWPELTTMLRHLLQPAGTPRAETPAAANVRTSFPSETVLPTSFEAPQVPAEASEVEPTAAQLAADNESTHETNEDPFEERRRISSLLRGFSPVTDPLLTVLERAVSSTNQEYRTAVEESPLGGEALLNRPASSNNDISSPREFSTSLTEYLARMLPPVPRPPTPTLSATFVSDNNIPDGQYFPPGAEFVKSWKMLNSGNTAWPEDCHLVFVAGDRLAPYEGAPRQVKIGAVPPGAEVEVTSGEMKVSH